MDMASVYASNSIGFFGLRKKRVLSSTNVLNIHKAH
jgi:hypothetical protein